MCGFGMEHGADIVPRTPRNVSYADTRHANPLICRLNASLALIADNAAWHR